MKAGKLLFILLFVAGSVKSQTIEVSAGNYPRYHTPLQVTLSKPLPVNKPYRLINTKTGTTTAAQLTDSVTLAFILPDSLPAGASATFRLEAGRKQPQQNIIAIKKEKDGLQVQVGKRPLFFYHTATVMPPAGSPDYYKRSGFIHPLYSPGGTILTDDFPEGHRHQHALFMAWVKTTFKNDFTDFWNQQHQKGTIEHIEVLKTTEGPVLAQLQVMLRYKSLEHGDVLHEKWTLTCYPFTGYFLFDLASEQTNITQDTLYLEKYHYGGLAFRGNRQWNPDDKTHFREPWHILTSEGIKDTLANHTHAAWVSAYGTVDGKVAGATVFNHPSNFRYPQAIRVHPAMPYWCYAPMVDGAFTIDPGARYRSKFRYYVHDGEPETQMIRQLHQDWTEPPVVSSK